MRSWSGKSRAFSVTREGPQLGLVQLEAHDLEDAELDAVDADGAVALQVGEHEAERQRQRRFYNGLPGLLVCGLGPAQGAACHGLRSFE